MPFSRFQSLKRVKAVEREHTVTRFATDNLLRQVRQDPNTLEGELRIRDVDDASQRLEGTYIIRLFAEFESTLRTYWLASRGNYSPSRTRDLLDGIAAKRKIPDDQRKKAHAVREYRNALIHEGDVDIVPIPLPDARSNLCYFLSFLPVEW